MRYPQWVLPRVLDFLNQSRSVEQILSNPQLKDASGNGYVIGEKVAQKIIDHRSSLPRRRYQSKDDVLAVSGLGEDKFNDLMHSFFNPADEAFQELLFNGILYDNWVLQPQVKRFDSLEEMQAVTHGLDRFRRTVVDLWVPTRSWLDARAQKELRLRIRQAYVAGYPSSHLAAFQFAYWWYQFDQDNWFSYDRIKEACETYL
ncbi:MAG: hypothetical protein AAFQ37_13065, partial [Bacteroidota bacterium]